MNLSSSSRKDHGGCLERKTTIKSSSAPLSTQSSFPSTSMSASSTSKKAYLMDVSKKNFPHISVSSIEDVSCNNQPFPDMAEGDLQQRKRSPYLYLTSALSSPSFQASSCQTAFTSHQSDHNISRLELSETLSCHSTQYCSTECFDATENPANQSRQLVCCWKTCGKTFLNQKELALHVNVEHVRMECPDVDFQCRWQGCPRQGRGFNARYKMLIHIRTHTNEKPHMCGVCNKSFSRLENLKIHTRSHTGEKPYMCTFPGCCKAYSNSSDRFKHVRTHQEEKPYKCKMPGCWKCYTDPSSLRKHVRTHGHTLDPSGIMLHPSSSSEELGIDDLKVDKIYCAIKQNDELKNDVNNSHVCELSNLGNSNHRHIQKRSKVHDNTEVINDASKINGKYVGFGKNLNNCENCIELVREVKFSKQKTSNLNQFGQTENNINHLSGLRDAAKTQELLWQKQNKISEVSNTDIHEQHSLDADKDQRNSEIKWKTNSEKLISFLNSHSYCDEQMGRKRNNKEQIEKNFVFNHKVGFMSDSSQTPVSRSPFPIQELLETKHPCFSSIKNNNCNKRTYPNSSSPSLISPKQPTKTSHIEHWKKRKIMNQKKESQTFLPSTSPPTHLQSCHSSPDLINSQSSCASPASPSVSLFSHVSTTSSDPFTDTHSPNPSFSLSPNPTHIRAGTPSSSTVTPLLPPIISQSPSSMSVSPLSQAGIPDLYFSHYYPPPLYPVLSNSYSSTPCSSDTSLHSSRYTPNLQSLTLSACSILPLLNSYHYDSIIDPHHDLYPTYFLSTGSNICHSQYQLAGIKNAWEPASFNNLAFLRNLEDTTLLSAVSLNHFTRRLGFMYQDFPLDLSPFHQCHRLGFPLHLGVRR